MLKGTLRTACCINSVCALPLIPSSVRKTADMCHFFDSSVSEHQALAWAPEIHR